MVKNALNGSLASLLIVNSSLSASLSCSGEEIDISIIYLFCRLSLLSLIGISLPDFDRRRISKRFRSSVDLLSSPLAPVVQLMNG